MMEHREGGVFHWDLVVCIEDPQLPGVLKWVSPEAEQVEQRAKGPDVSLLRDELIAVQVHHFWGTVHWSGTALDLQGEREGVQLNEKSIQSMERLRDKCDSSCGKQ